MTKDEADVGKMAPDDLRAYMRKRVEQFEKKKGITDEMGGTRSDFCDATGVNKTALGFMERLNRMTPEVRGDVLRSIDVIREGMGPVWDQQMAMDLDDDREPEERLEQARTSARRGRKPKEPVHQPIAASASVTPPDVGTAIPFDDIESAPMPGDDFLGEVA
jgi:hypothetical protein